MRLLSRAFTALGLMILIISYQNFSKVSSSEWDSSNTLKVLQEMKEFENKQNDSIALATPESGTDLNSIGNNWAQKQGTLLLNGYDKKLENAMNEKLNSWVEDLIATDPSEGPLVTEESAAGPQGEEATGTKKHKQNLRFARVNSLKYDLGENSYLDMTADPGNTRFNYSQALSQRAKVGVEHRTSGSQTQMFLKYEW